MTDVFVEYIVKQKIPFYIYLFKAFILTLGVMLFIIGMFIFPFLGLYDFYIIGCLLGVLALVGAIYVFRLFNIEYEYSFVNGEMDVDKITSRSKRKRLTTVDFSDIENIGQYKEVDHVNKSYANTIFACEDKHAEENIWYIHYKDRKLGNTLLVFNPSERLLDAIKQALPKQVAFSVFGRN